MKLPSTVTWIGTLVLTVVGVLNETVFDLPTSWHAYLGLALYIGAGLGLKALGPGLFAAALKLPQWVNALITGVIGAIWLAVSLDHSISSGVHAVIAAVLMVLNGLGFGAPSEFVAQPSVASKTA